jgi:predicted pyridoxine 5'-phosphate oxidase superfamily flavin-nucleotide-binding protein
MLRDSMPEQHREFFEALPFLVVGSRDAAGAVWASLLIGEPGFVKAPSARRLGAEAAPLPGDPLQASLKVGRPLGLLGIELFTRRRNRVNGQILSAAPTGFELAVEQSFGNCKQYIQARAGVFSLPGSIGSPRLLGARLAAAEIASIERADTTFIASSSPAPQRGGREGVDVSHRGGLPGFIRATQTDAATLITLPDYSGNFMFNTLGNIEVSPRVGFLVLDFAGDVLISLSGRARVIWQGPEVAAVPGAERLLEVQVEQGLLWRGLMGEWSAPEISPQLARLAGTRE